MDNTEKEITLEYLRGILALKEEEMGDLIEEINDIYEGRSQASMSACASKILVKSSEISRTKQKIEDLEPDPVPGG